jgi:hypothetical protein
MQCVVDLDRLTEEQRRRMQVILGAAIRDGELDFDVLTDEQREELEGILATTTTAPTPS